MWRALGLAVGLALWGNGFNLAHARLHGRWREAWAWLGPLSLLSACAAWDLGYRRRALSEAGITRAGVRHGALIGAAAGAVLAAPALVWFRLPGRRHSLEADEAHVSLSALLARLFVVTPLLVALVEEVAFRGVLQSRLQRALPQRPTLAVLVSSASFALWHVTVNLQTLRRTNVVSGGIAALPVALAGGLGAVFAGGAVFGELYRRTGSLTAPFVAHWTVDALMLLALWRRPRT